MSDDKLDTCGCCEGEERLTPAATYNPPGLDALAFRVGTHAAFLETMIADLARHEMIVKTVNREGQEVENRIRPLSGLKTRRRDDFSIALLDAWATIADVLIFYQERIANEGYLRTATERRSILELARLVGYELAPGVAASTYLSFIIDETEGMATIPAGTRAQSIPRPGETMQSFETMAEMEARYEYNELKLRTTRPQFITAGALPETLYLPGQRNDLRPPAHLLLAFGPEGLGTDPPFDDTGTYYLLRVKQATLVEQPARTAVHLYPGAVRIDDEGARIELELTKAEAKQPYLTENWRNVAAAIGRGGRPTRRSPLSVLADAGNPDIGFQGAAALNSQFAKNIYGVLTQEVASQIDDEGILRALVVLPLQARLHGHNASMQGQTTEVETGNGEVIIEAGEPAKVIRTFGTRLSEWTPPNSEDRDSYSSEWHRLFHREPENEAGAHAVVTLDRVYETIGVESLVVLTWRDRDNQEKWVQQYALYQVMSAQETSTGLFNQPATVTRLELKRIKGAVWNPTRMDIIRSTTVYAASELVSSLVPNRILDLEPLPDTYTVSGRDVEEAQARQVRVWDVVAERYALSAAPHLLAEANHLALDVDLQSGQTLLIPVGQELELDGIYRGIKPGRWLALSGMRADVPISGNEVALVQAVDHRFARTPTGQQLPGDVRHTFLVLAEPPSLPYRRATLRLSANTVPATHGETARGVPPREQDVILGSGDGTQDHQQFPLKLQTGKRLTYLPAATSSGVSSTLQVYVGDVLWQFRNTLLGAGPREHVYSLRTGDDGQAEVVFGNGIEGARPPSGRENVWARYRVGIGQAGNVEAGQISLLATRPAGVKEVSNRVPATGGTDPENRDQARQSVLFAARTLGRLVGLQDYQDLARTFAGIGKALAQYDAARQEVTVYVAGQDNTSLEGSEIVANLEKVLDEHDGSNVQIRVIPATLRLVSLDASVYIAPDRLWERVQPAVRAALEADFAFGRRELGQAVALSEIVHTIQKVPGVTHVQITRLAALNQIELMDQASNPPAIPLGKPVTKEQEMVEQWELAFIDSSVPSLVVLSKGE